MTRQERFDVHVSPEVERSLHSQRLPPGLAQRFTNAMRRLSLGGTRAMGVKKLRGLDLWEIRVGTFRAYFCPVPGSGAVAVGALLEKKTRRHRPAELKTIEARVHRWRDDVEVGTR